MHMKRSYLGLLVFIIIISVVGMSVWYRFTKPSEITNVNIENPSVSTTADKVFDETEGTSVTTDGTFVNTAYGFEMNLSGDAPFHEEGVIYGSLGAKEGLQYTLGDPLNGYALLGYAPNGDHVTLDSLDIRVIKNQSAQEYAASKGIEDAGPYLKEANHIEVNGLPVEYIEYGYASGYVLRMYNFEKDKNTISVSIYTSKNSNLYESIIKTFKLL